MQLRKYQLDAVNGIYNYLRQYGGNPCAVLPTGSGKTPILASIARDTVKQWHGRILVLAHVKELLEQSVQHLQEWAPELSMEIGLHSAGLKSRDVSQPVLVAGIQSVYKRASELGHFDLIMVDEAHRIPPEGDGMYRTYVAGAKEINPNVRLIGLTATPFRMKSGLIVGPEELFSDIAYEISVKELILKGFLSKLISKGPKVQLDFSQLHIRAGEFVQSEAEELMDQADVVGTAAEEIAGKTANRNSVLIFATGVAHAEHVAAKIRQTTEQDVGTIFGHTPAKDRHTVVKDFKSGRLKYLVNCEVLTLGFDAPNVDCVALVRPTYSPGLYYQMVGRGFRTHPDKADCLVLDFGGNILRHGPVDCIRVTEHRSPDGQGGSSPAKQCPECQSIIHAAYSVCPDCGYEFPKPDATHDGRASGASILSGEPEKHIVYETAFVIYKKSSEINNPNHPHTLRVDYRVTETKHEFFGARWFSEYLCFDHHGFARIKAERWWAERSAAPVPGSVHEAYIEAHRGVLADTSGITTRKEGKYDRVIAHEYGDWPDLALALPIDGLPDSVREDGTPKPLIVPVERPWSPAKVAKQIAQVEEKDPQGEIAF